MRFSVLGPLAVWTAEGEPVAVPEAKVRALLASLLVNLGQPVSADRLIDHLWGAAPPARAINTLQTKVSQLRRVLESAAPDGRRVLVHQPAGYVLKVQPDALDAHRFHTLTARAREAREPQDRAEGLAAALSLWRGAALADFRDEPFAQAAITRLEEDRLVALEEQAEARLELGEHAQLAVELADLVALHPLRERLRAAHIRALYGGGRPSEALASYHNLRERLADELGLDPGAELVALQQSILRQDPALTPGAGTTGSPVSAPASESAAPAPGVPQAPELSQNSVPAPLTTIVGRAQAIDEIHDLLRGRRLITLTGPGGVGKTRLALAVAARLAGPGIGSSVASGGIWFAELAAVPRPAARAGHDTVADIADLIASTLGIRDDSGNAASATLPGASTLDRLARSLHGRDAVLVLDNCEHLIEPVAELAGRLLGSAPGLRILTTSREPLGVAGEHVQRVPPLELPAAAATDPEILESFSAMQLFVARAAAAAPGFALTAENAAEAAAICRRLDGIPLAIELAASRVPGLGVSELAARMDDRFQLLTAGKRGVPARQRTLRAMIDWSWELLEPTERTVLRRLAAHSGGATLASAEAVCADTVVPIQEVAPALARLVDQSLVVATQHDSETRYGLLESVATYCQERLAEAGEAMAAAGRQRRYYLELAEHAEAHLRDNEQCRWLRRLTLETANLRLAIDTAITENAVDDALRLVNALAWGWYLRGRRREAIRTLGRVLDMDATASAALTARARSWYAGLNALDRGQRSEPADAVLKLFDDTSDPEGRAYAHWLLGYAEYGFGNLALSERLADEALASFERSGHRWGTAASLVLKAAQAVFHGDLPAVLRYGEQAAAIFTQLGDGWGRLEAIDVLGTHAEITGDYEAAQALYEEGRGIAEYLEMWSEYSSMLSRMGRIALLLGDYARADHLHQQAADLAARHDDLPNEEMAGLGLALSARRQGHLDTAERHLLRWLEWNHQLEAHYGTSLIRAELGFVAELRGDAEAARIHHTQSLAGARSTGDPRAVALALEGLAGAASLDGHHTWAARLLGASTTLRERVGAPLPPAERTDVDRITARVRHSLGEPVFSEEFATGTELTPDDLV
ncbi:BTAD domain-containing putative transcriptional regulator [Phytoactinopolyspora mesophila]|uniref:AfsR/SARP family transcriptional regulator n=1 Tax=Phytoactinopolyspora mesophila TaxID=2650750 RepID=A0A7K3LY28_9ACTN|nr:BTAD domain-containing putative transcriptional regulator [Phytoactinopolyspora mesophila]NDL55936.1 AfsR/SARP family transcriptional regulator [Phytoactinopolyspora mesophila]